MGQILLSDARIEGEIEPILRSMRPGGLLRSSLLTWAAFGTLFGLGSIWASDTPWTEFEPTLRWVLLAILGPGAVAGALMAVRLRALRHYLTSTNTELRSQVEKDWSTLTGPGWPGRVIRFTLGASLVGGVSVGTFLSVAFPAERLLGSTLASIGATAAMFLVPLVPMAFGFRALLVRAIRRRVEPGGIAPGRDALSPDGGHGAALDPPSGAVVGSGSGEEP